MYDCIIQCSPLLPSGVTLAEVLEGSSANDVKDIVASLPDSGTISAAAMITAGQSNLHLASHHHVSCCMERIPQFISAVVSSCFVRMMYALSMPA